MASAPMDFACLPRSMAVYGSDRADVNNHRHAMFHLLNDNLGNFLPFLRRHRRPLAVRTQDKKRMHAAGDKPVGELAHQFFIDAAIFQKNGRTRQNDAAYLFDHDVLQLNPGNHGGCPYTITRNVCTSLHHSILIPAPPPPSPSATSRHANPPKSWRNTPGHKSAAHRPRPFPTTFATPCD